MNDSHPSGEAEGGWQASKGTCLLAVLACEADDFSMNAQPVAYYSPLA